MSIQSTYYNVIEEVLVFDQKVHPRKNADKRKKLMAFEYAKLIKNIKNEHEKPGTFDLKAEREKFYHSVTEAIKAEAWARLNGSHRSEYSSQQSKSPEEIGTIRNFEDSFVEVLAHWLKVVDTAGYALSFSCKREAYLNLSAKNKSESKTPLSAAEATLIKDCEQLALQTEQNALACEKVFIDHHLR